MDKLILPQAKRRWEWTPEEKSGSPGLVIMGGDSCSKGCEFESRHYILDGHFSHLFFEKNCNVCLKRQK